MNIIKHPSRAKCEGCGNELRISTDGIKYQVEECPCMSTKTWQDEFDKQFQSLYHYYGDGGSNDSAIEEVKQFITDLRKQDEQQLLLKLSLETQYYGRDVEMKISKIIEEYYAK